MLGRSDHRNRQKRLNNLSHTKKRSPYTDTRLTILKNCINITPNPIQKCTKKKQSTLGNFNNFHSFLYNNNSLETVKLIEHLLYLGVVHAQILVDG